MADLEGIRTGRHCVFALHAHLVFVTMLRHTVFGDRHYARMEEIMRAVCADFETELVEFNGENNHVHLLVNFPPKVALAKLVNSLEGVSSRQVAAGVPRPAAALLPVHPAVVRLVLRRPRRRRTGKCRASVHRAAEPPGLRHARAWRPSRAAFTPP